MSYKLKTNLSNKKNYGSKRKESQIKYLIYHATSNDGDSDEGNTNYFKNNIVKSSAHAFVDDDSVTISVPANYIAYSVGGKKYTDCSKTGGGTMYGKITNTNSYSIELCDTKKNGKYDFTEKTLKNAAEYGKEVMKKYNIPIENVYMHFHVNGKHCPIQWYNHINLWNEFKKRLSDKENSTSSNPSTPTIPSVSKIPIKPEKEFKIKVIVEDLNIRSGAGTNYEKVGCIKNKGTYTIIKTSGNWGFLKSKVGWINISEKYVKRL